MRFRRSLVAGTAAAAVLATGGTAFSVRDGGDDRTGDAQAPSLSSTPITRGDLVDTETVDGTLTYSGERKVAGALTGTVTWIPAPGRVIEQGEALYQVNRRRVTLMYGRLPLYRTLCPGIAGPDVEQLERALRALGHGDGMIVDRRFTAATAQAVRNWQDDTGLDETGAVDAAQVVFLPAEVRVTEAKAALGDKVGPGTHVLTVTGTEQIVHVDLKASDRRLARAGARVTVELPDGATVSGRIAKVGTVAEKPDSGGQEDTGAAGEPTVDVEIELTGDEDTGGFDQAPVSVRLESGRRERVLTVPVEALLALREGGLGVEVLGPGGVRRVVAVRTGAYGGGRVEISGPGLAEGVRVGVPRE